jgi:hypothetical protein
MATKKAAAPSTEQQAIKSGKATAKRAAPKSNPRLIKAQEELNIAVDTLKKLFARFQKEDAAGLITDVETLQKRAYGIERAAARVVNQCHYMEGVGQ